MLNILEGYDIAALGFGTVETIHLLAEVLKIAFADRAEASGDPAFVKVPVERITSKAYADERRAGIDLARATRHWTGALRANGGGGHDASHRGRRRGQRRHHHVQTINSLFGARFIVPGTGMVPTNSTCRTSIPGRAMRCQIMPGKRVTTSMCRR